MLPWPFVLRVRDPLLRTPTPAPFGRVEGSWPKTMGGGERVFSNLEPVVVTGVLRLDPP